MGAPGRERPGGLQEYWCERGESNPHGCPLDPKSSASASSATLAKVAVISQLIDSYEEEKFFREGSPCTPPRHPFTGGTPSHSGFNRLNK